MQNIDFSIKISCQNKRMNGNDSRKRAFIVPFCIVILTKNNFITHHYTMLLSYCQKIEKTFLLI